MQTKPVTINHLNTVKAGFAVKLADDRKTVKNLFYSLVLTRTSATTNTPLYLRTRFPKPTSPQDVLIVDSVLPTGQAQIIVNSPTIKRVQKNTDFQVMTQIFSDDKRTRLIGTHEQRVHAGLTIDSIVHY